MVKAVQRVMFLAFLLFVTPWVSAEFVVSHRSAYAPGDTHHLYSTALLQLALEKTRSEYGDFRLQPMPPRNYTRSLKAVVDNTYPNLVVETSYEQALTHHAQLDFIDFPVDLGVLGYRVCFINPKLKATDVKIETLAQLQQYTFVHGVGWADTEVFRHNGLKVQEIENYDGIFLMVIGGRVDFFCRGVNEVLGEKEQFKHLSKLMIDDHFMLVYPLPRFFYFNKSNQLAKKRISLGLDKAYADGSLQQLWQVHHRPSLDLVKLQGRNVIYLENPLLKEFKPRVQPDFMSLLQEDRRIESKE
jgi:hypothetical protein